MKVRVPMKSGSSGVSEILPSDRRVEPVHKVVKEEPEKPKEKDLGQIIDTYV
jgi:hypothetical protein